MEQVYIKILDIDGQVLAAAQGGEEVNLFYPDVFQEGDKIVIEATGCPGLYWIQLDDALGCSLVYMKNSIEYTVPFGERRLNLAPKVFSGRRHLLRIRKARSFEYHTYRNLALNVNDQFGIPRCYPHASANVETRGEVVFAARNVIDGVTATECHGKWPYQSWGIGQRDNAALKLDFGRTVEIDRIVLYTRADFPHDNWWEKGTVTFSDGSEIGLELRKTGNAQEFIFGKKQVEWLELGRLIKSEEPSPFPALVQLEAYGTEV